MFLRLTTSDREGVRDVAVEAEPTVTVAELGQSLGLPASALSGADPATEITRAGVFEGATLPRTSSDRLPVGAMRLEFVAGPFSGETVGLPAGSTITVGSGEGMLLRVLDPSLDSHHATLVVTDRVVRGSSDDREHWVTVRPAGTPGTVVVNGERLTEDAQIGTQDLVQLGSSVVRVGRVPVSDADIVADGSGWLAFNRGARIRPPTARPTVTLPGTQPADRDRAPLPWIAMLLPVIMGVTMATLFHSPRFLMFAFMSPLMVAGNFSMNRRRDRRTGERTLENWRQEVADARDAVARLRRLQRLRAWRERLDPVTLADIAIAPTARLWERRLTDPDAVEVRIGVGDADLDVSFEGKRLREDGIDVPIGVSPSPIVVNLAAGPVGIAGPRAITAGLARSMLVQLAVTRSPRDLDIVVLCEDGGEADWSWVRWLPHCNGGVSAFARIGNTNESRAARLRELGALIDRRWGAGDSREPIDSQTVVFIDQARAFRMLPAMITLLERGPAVGVLVVAIDDDRAKLPQECATEVLIDGVDLTLGRVVATTGSCDRFLLDAVTPGFAEQIARALSPVVHAAGAGDESLLPSYSRFVDLLGIDLDDHDWLVRSWTPGRRETRAVVGAGLHAPFALDLALDGPHALVAGTTGAGKSEFLQTLVVSLALVNRPDALNFVFVDYRAGRLSPTVSGCRIRSGW
jgi:S-DNA-T family DNA segregation ATPase FtsK/SpoIIIE